MPTLLQRFRSLAFAVFQLFFAAITPALITGAFAERMKFWAFMRLYRLMATARIRASRTLGLGTWRLDPRTWRT